MIFVNDVEWKDWAKDLGKGYVIPEGGITFKRIPLGQPRMHRQLAKGNMIGEIPVEPSGLNVPLFCTIEIEGESKSVRYSSLAPTKDAKGNIKYQDSHLLFQNGRYTVATDKSLIWFLLNHAYNRDSLKSSLTQRFFFKEDATAEANVKIKTKVLTAKANNLLWSEMADKDVLEMYLIHKGRECSSASVARIELEKFANDDPQKFIDMFNSDVKSVKRIILMAKNHGLIEFVETGENKHWRWIEKDGKAGGIITKIVKGRNAEDDLYEYLTTHGDGKAALELIEGSLGEKRASK